MKIRAQVYDHPTRHAAQIARVRVCMYCVPAPPPPSVPSRPRSPGLIFSSCDGDCCSRLVDDPSCCCRLPRQDLPQLVPNREMLGKEPSEASRSSDMDIATPISIFFPRPSHLTPLTAPPLPFTRASLQLLWLPCALDGTAGLGVQAGIPQASCV